MNNDLKMLLRVLRRGKCQGPAQIQIAQLIDNQADELNRLAEAFVVAYTTRIYETFILAGMTAEQAEARVRDHLTEMNPIERLMRGRAGAAFEHLKDPRWS